MQIVLAQDEPAELKADEVKISEILENETAYHGEMVVVEGKIELECGAGCWFVLNDGTGSIYYFHPTERCPIDQSIEQNLLKLMQSSFAKEIKDGKIKFQVINTDDKSQAKTVARFDINAQALYIVSRKNGKEIKNDLTRFAFDYGQSNPDRFRSGLKVEIDNSLK